MRKSPTFATAALLALVTWGCGPSVVTVPVMVPPQIDLRPHETIGVVRFDAGTNDPLGSLATTRFTEAARRDQGLIRFVDLGSQREALGAVGRDRLDAEAVVALGRKYDVKTIVLGEIKVSSARPDIRIDSAWKSGGIAAQVDAVLDVRMVEAGSGASLWNGSGRASQSVGHVSVAGGRQISFDASDPEKAYAGLVDNLVEQVTRPFHVTWERR